MTYLLLVFLHLLATSMALGAIVATDLRMLSKLAQDKVRIPPPNEFVARLVTIALALLYLTGAGILWLGSQKDPQFLANPKLQAKLALVLLLTVNACVLHRWTFPRLARGRSVGRWKALDWLVVVLPVSLSNCLWMFCAFLGIARPWNHAVPIGDVLAIAAALWLFAVVTVGLVLAVASRRDATGLTGLVVALVKRALAAIGRLGRALEPATREPSRRARSSASPRDAAAQPTRDPASRPARAAPSALDRTTQQA